MRGKLKQGLFGDGHCSSGRAEAFYPPPSDLCASLRKDLAFQDNRDGERSRASAKVVN
jgi:hypothetical protein